MRWLGLAGVVLWAGNAAAAGALLTPAEVESLRAARPGDRVALATVPRSSRLLDSAVLKRIDVYAPDAKIYVVRDDGPHEVPRSDELQFISVSGPTIALSVAADGRSAHGTLWGGEGQNYRLRGVAAPLGLELRVDGFFDEAPDGGALRYNIDGFDDVLEPEDDAKRLSALEEIATVKAASAATRQAVVAIDTDNELLQQKFSDNTTNATNYIASLFTNMNVIYERDLDVTLVQGTTFLRPSSTPDPYPSTSATATDAQLNEFGEYWRLNNSGVACAFALLLSGKSSSPNSASGIAWLLKNRNYCTATGQVQGNGSTFGHFGLDRVFKFAGSTAATDTLVAAHELGHNFGAGHTHCTDATTGNNSVGTNTIDQCYSGEGACCGCYAGSQSCPASHTVNGVTNVTGTLMSYCHLNGIAGCGSSKVFADIQRTVLGTYIALNFPSCITATNAPNQAPTIIAPLSISVTEDVATALSGISYADVDAGTNPVVATLAVASGSIAAGACAGVTAGGTTASRTLTGTLANVNSCLSGGAVTFTTASNSTTTVVLTASINDQGNTGSGGAKSGSANSNLTVTAVNDAPTVAAPATLAVMAPGTTPLGGITIADVDAAAGSVTLTLATTQGTLTGASSGGVTASGSGTATLTLSGTLANLSAYLAVPGQIAFAAAAALPGNTATLSSTLNDNGNTGSGGAKSGNASTTLSADIVFFDGFE
jgi:hypothetical protein